MENVESKCTSQYHKRGIRIGEKVEPFVIETYNPIKRGFDSISFEQLWKDGKWIVLFFYPADFTFVWPTELADLANQHEALKALGVEVITVSTDKVFSHLAWHNEEKLIENVKYQMGADPKGCLSRFFGVYNYDDGMAMRGTFIINPNGILEGSEISYHNIGRNCSELVRKVQAHVYLSKNTAEACPANWTPGEATLTPSADMVGKVFEALNK